MVEWTIESLLDYLGYSYTFIGRERKSIYDIAPLDRGSTHDLSFCASDDNEGILSVLSSDSGIILCKKGLEELIHRADKTNDKTNKRSTEKLFVFVDNPRLVFIRVAKLIKDYHQNREGLSEHALVSVSAKIGRDCYIGDFTVVGDECIIGDNTIIDSRVVIKNSIIGNNCLIQSGNIIGEGGFSFERDDTNMKLERFPHYGKVIIMDNVEILSNCSITRGSLSDTIIEKGTKIDALCHVAHNVHIGKNSQLTAGVIVGGSTKIGDSCWLGLNSTIKHKIEIGNNAIVGSGSSVIHNVEAKDIVAGVPAKSIKHKINISKDKLFLMGGQESIQTSQDVKKSEKKDCTFKIKGSTIFNILFCIPFFMV